MTLSEAALRARIIDALNIGFMLEGFEARPLQVTIFAEAEEAGIMSRRLIFADPLVGEFEALQLEPAGSAPVPAIIGLHGHGDTPAIFANKFLGSALAADGYLVLMPQFRAMNCVGPEDEISRTLISGGFHLMAMRVYEIAAAGQVPALIGARRRRAHRHPQPLRRQLDRQSRRPPHHGHRRTGDGLLRRLARPLHSAAGRSSGAL